jgi:hypothetical protein
MTESLNITQNDVNHKMKTFIQSNCQSDKSTTKTEPTNKAPSISHDKSVIKSAMHNFMTSNEKSQTEEMQEQQPLFDMKSYDIMKPPINQNLSEIDPFDLLYEEIYGKGVEMEKY